MLTYYYEREDELKSNHDLPCLHSLEKYLQTFIFKLNFQCQEYCTLDMYITHSNLTLVMDAVLHKEAN